MSSFKHGLSSTKEYRIWSGMMQRCYNKKSISYINYGARGIFVCKRWHDLNNFIKDMGECPKGKTLERINNNNWYSPQNCKWATMKEQCRNRRNTRLVMINGVKKSLSDWCDIYKVNWFTIRDRLNSGMSPEKSFSIPIGEKKKIIYLEFNGKRQTLDEWSKETGILKRTLHTRYVRGWSSADILTRSLVPVGCKRKYLDLNYTDDNSINTVCRKLQNIG